MVYVIGIAVLIVLVCVLTDNLTVVLVGLAGLIVLMTLFILLFSIIGSAMLLTSHWREASFTRLDLPKETSRFKVAFYQINEGEIPNMFPEEGIMEQSLYKEGHSYKVLYNRKLGRVFDRFSILTILLGLVSASMLGGVLVVALI